MDSGEESSPITCLQEQVAALAISHSSATYSCVGGKLPPIDVLIELLTEYLTSDALAIPPAKPVKAFWAKLSIDNTRVFYTKTEGYYLSLLDVEKCQSAKHQVPIAITKTVDENSEMQRVVTECDMLELVDAANALKVTINGSEFPLVLFLVLIGWDSRTNWT